MMFHPNRFLFVLAILVVPPAWAEPVLTYGESQVRRMDAERPALGRAIDEHPDLRVWLVDQLDGRSTGFPITWDGADPTTGNTAEHEFALGYDAAKVRVRSDLSGLDQLSGLIFELENIRGFATFESVWQSAMRGEIDRRQFTERMAACEFAALARTRAFLADHLASMFVPELREHPLTAHLLDASPTLEEQERKYLRLGHRIGNRFAAIYDAQIRPRLIVAN